MSCQLNPCVASCVSKQTTGSHNWNSSCFEHVFDFFTLFRVEFVCFALKSLCFTRLGFISDHPAGEMLAGEASHV